LDRRGNSNFEIDPYWPNITPLVLRQTCNAGVFDYGSAQEINMPKTIHVLNGPNLNLLGEREPAIYGHDTLADIEGKCREVSEAAGFELIFQQTNAEHEMVDWIQAARAGAAGIIINPAAFSYAAYPILDALKLVDCPVIEVHISNIHRREAEWRSKSIMTQVVTGMISGLGINGYALAVRQIIWLQSGH
jgi:3-dehydroquinate dehydratase II